MSSSPDSAPDAPSEHHALEQWFADTRMSYSAFSREIPCSLAYPRMLAKGIARPSYEMACRIEEVTGGAVLRTNWYPVGSNTQSIEQAQQDIEDI